MRRIALWPKTCCKTHGCRRGCQRVPTSQACCGNAFGCSAVRFLQRVPSGCRRVPTAPVGASRIAAHDLLPKTQVPTRVPAGADLAGVLPKRFRLQRRAVLAGRVPKGADRANGCNSFCPPWTGCKTRSADGRASGCRDGVREGRKGRGIEGRHVRRTDVCKRGKKGGRYGEEAEEAADRGIARV